MTEHNYGQAQTNFILFIMECLTVVQIKMLTYKSEIDWELSWIAASLQNFICLQSGVDYETVSDQCDEWNPSRSDLPKPFPANSTDYGWLKFLAHNWMLQYTYD